MKKAKINYKKRKIKTKKSPSTEASAKMKTKFQNKQIQEKETKETPSKILNSNRGNLKVNY